MPSGKRDDGPAWFKRLGIDRTCQLVAMCRGMVTLTRTDDGMHTLWLCDHPLLTSDATTARRAYSQYLIGPDTWLYKFYA